VLDHAYVPIPKVDKSTDPTHHAQDNTIIVRCNIGYMIYYYIIRDGACLHIIIIIIILYHCFFYDKSAAGTCVRAPA
jgi:hypothetical protein